MGTSSTSKYKLVKPDDNESVTISQLNGNMDKIESAISEVDTRLTKEVVDTEKLIPSFLVGGIPSGKKPKVWFGNVKTTTGAGGENRTAKFATDFNGTGGIWLGYLGVPKFEGISYCDVNEAGNGAEFAALWAVTSYSTTRIKFRGRRVWDGGGQPYANGYANVNLSVMIVGW